MEKISLNGKWNLYFHLEEGEMPSSIDEVKEGNRDRIEAEVPGNVEVDLCNAGVEKDPFLGLNLYDYKKYEFYQWWYERSFEVPEDFKYENAVLVLKGIDTYSTIWVNGANVGETANMMIEHRLDVTRYLKPGKTNHVTIRIKSPMNVARNKDFPVSVMGGERIDEMVWIRKPGHSFGWDIAPRLLSAGIWRDIEIEAVPGTHIKEIYYATKALDADKAELLVKYRFKTDVPIIEGFSVRIRGKCNSSEFKKECAAGFCSGETVIQIDNPLTWWPKGYGEQNLYDVTMELMYKGSVVDSRNGRIGIRLVDIETNYEPGDTGEFKIKVNGTPILAKGTNWVALDALHSRDSKRLKKAHDLLEDVGCNIVRCWGGNVYEDHAFFDLCDERGIMVWQDFSLACAIYPQNDGFADVIEKEAESIIRKLRNHPSIILWAGDNEVDGMYFWNGYDLPTARYNRISREVLPRAVGSHDPFRRYIPSSPYIPDDMTGDLSVPEQHNWGPRDFFKGDFYKNSTAHFISEIGYHGCPAVSSLKKYISPDNLWPFENNDEWDTHNTDYIPTGKRWFNRNELMAKQIMTLFGFIPEKIEDFVLASQISQAEAKKFFIEMVRLKKWRRTGVIWWNLLDCWPQISDAVVDYYFKKKIAYHYIKRVQNPICLMMDECENRSRKIILGNDSRTDAQVSLKVEDGDTGKVLLEGDFKSPANENIEVGIIETIPGEQRFYLLKWKIDGIEYGNHHIGGYVPVDFEKHKERLEKIQKLPQPFNYTQCHL